LGYLGIDGNMILKRIFKDVHCEGVDWNQLAQDMAQWWDFVDTVMNFLGSIKTRNFFEELRNCQIPKRTLLYGVG
jgi:hypothetical protein